MILRGVLPSVLAVITAIACAACTSDMTGSAQRAAETTSSSASSVSGMATGMGTASPSSSTSPPPARYPGGVAGQSLLREHHWLDEHGGLYFGEAVPDDPDIQQAFCDYLFGTVDQVADLARLTGTVALDPDSGYQNYGSNGTPFLCIYTVDGTQTFAMEIIHSRVLETRRSSDADDTADVDDSTKVTVQRGRLTGLADYAPTYQGDRADDATLRNWLAHAVGQMHQ